jgi:hypothetical protein
MKSLETVNVIKQVDVSVMEMFSYPDTPEGNKSAEAVFAMLVEEEIGKKPSQEDLDDALDLGTWETSECNIIICHSTGGNTCNECDHRVKSVMIDTDGTNLEEGLECSNPNCPSHKE